MSGENVLYICSTIRHLNMIVSYLSIYPSICPSSIYNSTESVVYNVVIPIYRNKSDKHCVGELLC